MPNNESGLMAFLRDNYPSLYESTTTANPTEKQQQVASFVNKALAKGRKVPAPAPARVPRVRKTVKATQVSNQIPEWQRDYNTSEEFANSKMDDRPWNWGNF